MGYPLKAYYGRRTFALLDECCSCKRPYDERDDWNTLQNSSEHGDVWLLMCDECRKAIEGEGE